LLQLVHSELSLYKTPGTRINAPRALVPVAATDCVITDYGAVADNKTVNTVAIQGAIDACHAASPAGSRVVVPAGAFKSGSLSLRSNMELHLMQGGGLYGSTNASDYPIVAGLPFGTMWQALVSGYNLTNVTISGENRAVPGNDSIIDGVAWWWDCLLDRHGAASYPNHAAAPYCKVFNPTNKTIADVAALQGVTGQPLRPKLIEFFNCTGVTLADFTAQNAACWTVHPTYSRDVTAHGVTVRGPREIGGISGFELDSCVNCLVENSHIDLGDDGICVKAYNYSSMIREVHGPTPSQNITVRQTTVLSRNICLGATTSGGVSDVLFEDMVLGEMDSPSMPWAVKFKISAGLIRNVTLRRIRIGKVGPTPWMYPSSEGTAFMIDFFDKNKTNPKTWVRGLTFEDITVVSARSLGHFNGPGSCIEGLRVINVTLAGPGKWACEGVDSASSAIRSVSPPLSCNGCMGEDDPTRAPTRERERRLVRTSRSSKGKKGAGQGQIQGNQGDWPPPLAWP
jgi:polygalacturonase